MHQLFNLFTDFILRLFGNNYLSVILLSFVPLIESAGAVPIALNLGLNPLESIFFSSIGAVIICPMIYLVLEPAIKWMKSTNIFRKFAEKTEENIKNQALELQRKAEGKRKDAARKLLLLFLFVLTPMPFSGLWTGSAVAIFLSLPAKSAVTTLIAANFASSSMVCLASLALGKHSYFVFLILVILIAVSFLTVAIRMIKNYTKKA
jgi:uncharacterized membrane protein